jgi:hypothetical protein
MPVRFARGASQHKTMAAVTSALAVSTAWNAVVRLFVVHGKVKTDVGRTLAVTREATAAA